MFPIAHAWLTEQLVPEPTPAHYLGCIWPDMLFESPLSHSQTHRSGERLVAHAAKLEGARGALFRQFVEGVLTHGSDPHGFDWYSDEEYGASGDKGRGYAFQRGLTLAKDAAVACDVPRDAGWWKAHNVIEMAFERPLFQERRSLGERLTQACGDASLVQAITGELAAVYNLEPDALATPILRFPEVAALQPAKVETLASRYALQTRLKHAGARPRESEIARLIERAEDIVAHDGQTFLAHCASIVGAVMRASLAAG